MDNIYVKYINNREVEFPPQNKGGVINYNLDIEKMLEDGYKLFIPAAVPPITEIRVYHFEYVENTNGITEVVVFDETQKEAEERIARVERERLNQLSLTKREVFLALYNDKGITPDSIKAQIQDPQALIEFEYANDYFRGNPLIDVIGQTLGYSSEDLDYLFLNKELPNKESEETNEN